MPEKAENCVKSLKIVDLFTHCTRNFMKTQNYSNHDRINPLYHGVLFAMILAGFILSGINLIQKSESEDLMESAILVMFSIILLFIFFFLRSFGLKLQERIIRNEQNLRHFMLTGKAMDVKLRMTQILALRFSPDDEFPELCQKAVKDRLSGDEIKKSIRRWKGDYHQI